MPSRYKLHLQAEQRAELEDARTHHEKAYVRERAAGILKVADGWAMCQVAAQGLLQPRAEETVKGWIARYQAEGLTGLLVRKGRGRKPAFFPSVRRRRGRSGA